MHFPSSTPSSSSSSSSLTTQNSIFNTSNYSSTSNNILFVPSNSSKMSFIMPNTNTTTPTSVNIHNNNMIHSSQHNIVSPSNILPSASTSGTATSINLNGINTQPNSHSNVTLSTGQSIQQRLPLQRTTLSQSQQISQEEFSKILHLLQEHNMTESAEIFKKEY